MRNKMMILGGVGSMLAVALAVKLSGGHVDDFSMHPLVQTASQSFALAAKTPYGSNSVTSIDSGEMMAASMVWTPAKIRQRLDETSLKNTTMPALPAVDARGRLIVGQELRDFFEYFGSLQGEMSAEEIDAMLHGYLQNALPAKAAAEAVALLSRYETLQQRQQHLSAPSGTSVVELTQTFEQLHALRREVLGDAAAEAFFADEEAYDRYSLEKMSHTRENAKALDIPAGKDSSDGVTTALGESEALAESLPVSLREREQARLHQQQLLAETDRMEKSGASADDIYQYQMLHSDADVAERYRALTEQRQHWDQRVSAYREQRNQIWQQSLADEQKNVMIQQLLAGSFSETEILRIQALEHMESR